MNLTQESALRAYARMLNTNEIEGFEELLADDFTYESQMVLEPIRSKQEFLDYMRAKLKTIRDTGATVYAEMGMVNAYSEYQPCVVLAQGDLSKLVGLVLATVQGNLLCRLDLCIVPPPQTAERTGDYPR